MEKRNIDYFEGRLEKDSYSKDEVAKMLHNESGFTAQLTKKEFDGMVSREDFDAVISERDEISTALKPYKEKEFNDLASAEFGKLNGVEDRFGDFKTISGLKGDEDAKAIAEAAIKLKETGKYNFMFTEENSGAVKNTMHRVETKKPKSGMVTPVIGSWFGKKK